MKSPSKPLLSGILVLACCALTIPGCGKPSSPKGEVSILEINQVASMLAMSPSGPPRTISELTNFPGFKGRRFPEPPAGSRFVLDPTTHQIVVVNK